MTDDEMRRLPLPALQPDWGILCLWVTGRAMELGRELIALWGYKRVDELVWVKTNQLQRLIRTGRTGHWLKSVLPPRCRLERGFADGTQSYLRAPLDSHQASCEPSAN